MPELPPEAAHLDRRLEPGQTYLRMMVNQDCESCGHRQESQQLYCTKCGFVLNMMVRTALIARLVGRKKPYKPAMLDSAYREINRPPDKTLGTLKLGGTVSDVESKDGLI